MKRIRLLAAAALILGGSVAVAMPTATAATASAHASASQDKADAIPCEGRSTLCIVNKDGLCLGLQGGRSDVPAVQFTCEVAANQDWHWGSELGTTNYFQLKNGDNQCLAVAAGSKARGAHIYGWRCLGTSHPDPYWANGADSSGTGNGIIINYHSQLVLGVAGASTKPGADIVQWSIKHTADQFWSECSIFGCYAD